MITGWNEIDRLFDAMDIFRSRMDRVFPDVERGLARTTSWASSQNGMRTNLYDVGDHLEVNAEVPGIGKEDLKVKIQGNYLEISGERKSDAPKGYSAHRVERASAAFSRSFTLPCDIDTNKVEATLQNGILHLRLPKAATAKPKQITVK